MWGMNFMEPFPSSFGNLYILLTVDYVSKWVEAMVTLKNDAKKIDSFQQKNILTCFGAPRLIVTEEGSIFITAYLRN